jgi:hypothetical protein
MRLTCTSVEAAAMALRYYRLTKKYGVSVLRSLPDGSIPESIR